MLNPVPMAKVAIVGPKTELEHTVDALHDLNLLHIDDYAPGDEGFDLGSPLPAGAQVSERLLRVRGLLKGANMAAPIEARRYAPRELAGLQEELRRAEAELSAIVERRTSITDALKGVGEEAAILQRVEHAPLNLNLTAGYQTLATATGFIPPAASLDALRAVHPDAEWVTSAEAEGTFVFVAAPRSAERALQDALAKLGFQSIELPPVEATPAARLAALNKERERLTTDLQRVEDELGRLRQQHAAAFYALDELLSLQADKATVPVRFRTTRNAFMVEGWVPRDGLARLRNAITNATGNLVFVTELPTPVTQPWKLRHAAAPAVRHHEDVQEGHEAAHAEVELPPVALRNPRAAGPYTLLTDTYSRPKYTELDPTMFFFIGFPLFYGIMLGDIAYGVLLLVLVWTGVFNKLFDFFGFQSKAHINRILLHSGSSSIAFGFLYTEFFGLELFGAHGVLSHYETHLGPIPFPLSRFENVKLLLFLTLLIAAVHLLLGLSLGVRNAAHEHGWSQAIKHRGSWLCILVAATLAMVVGLPGLLELEGFPEVSQPVPVYYAALGLFVLGVVLLVLGEGATALLELPTILSNLLSYTRLVAIGLSSAGIALAGNRVAEVAIAAGGVGGWVAAIFILLFFHALNLVLGVIGPALHSLRLHYVEFFTKFYEGGGEPFAPFGARRRYTTKEVKQA